MNASNAASSATPAGHAPSAPVLVGFDIGGTKCAVSTGVQRDGKIELLTRDEFPTPVTQDEAIARMCQAGRTAADGAPVLGVGISAGNPMDAARGILLNPPNLPGWSGLSLTDYAARELHAPAKLENDANACALAEYRCGAGVGSHSMMFLTYGTGFGAGLVLDGKLYRGVTGNAGEVGHWRIAPEGPSGYGKLGALEGYCSGGGMRQLALTVAERYRQLGLTAAYADEHDGMPAEISARTVAIAARNGDPAALEVFDICAAKLGEALALMIDIINPDCIVIGSIYARCEDLLCARMRKTLEREALSDSLAACRILPAALGDRIGDYAALALAEQAALTKQ